MRRFVFRSLALALCVILSTAVVFLPANADTAKPTAEETVKSAASKQNQTSSDTADYGQYAAAHQNETCPAKEASFDTKAIQGEKTVKTVEGMPCALLSSDSRSITYKIKVEEAGLYRLKLTYLPVPGKMKDVVFSLLIDGEFPFREAGAVSLSRVFEDAGKIQRDKSDNDIRPSQKEVVRFQTRELANTDGYYHDPYAFSFSSGTHNLTLTYAEEAVQIASVTLSPVGAVPSYKEYSQGAKESASSLERVQAEKSFEKSSSMLYPTYDRSTPATYPSHFSKIRYNTIGQANWSQQGQWISWKVSVKEDGWYRISLKARQNIRQGVSSCRSLRIDGEIPFKEATRFTFPYAMDWQMKTLSDESGNPYLFHLTKGEHTLALEVAAGEMGTVLKGVSDSVLELNSLYRSMIMVTGATPDPYRTYYLEESIPDLLERIKTVRDNLSSLYKKVSEITGVGGSEASVMKEMEVMLTEFLKKPLNIPERVTAFKDSIESMGSVILSLTDQPLELDYIVVSSNKKLPSEKAGFWDFLVYSVKGFLASFTEDYNSVSSSAGDLGADALITVWISNGRDQAQILKNRIDNDFTPNSGTAVKLSIVSTAAGTSSSTLVQATLAGKGPDVALFTPKDTPINLAMRGALTDLSTLSGYDKVYKRFYESAWIPYAYQGGMYAVPETQNYEMMFYRTDIFEEFGMDPPETWDEFYTVIEILQKSNLEVGVLETNALNAGISSGIAFFEKQLLQNGGTYYNAALNKTAFDKSVAYDAFKTWTDLYVEYGLDRSFDFYNRFRTGEMPIGIMGYGTFNQLYAAAPEIRGLWQMAPIPGTKQADGTVLRTETASGTAAVLLKDCKQKDRAWDFIKWWTDAPTQAAYGTELEASLGVAARYDTANREAFDSIGWTDEEAAVLKEQWAQVTDIPQIPGNYFISRCLTNAFRMVVDEGENPVRALNIYNKEMNAEIKRKRAEFGLDGE